MQDPEELKLSMSQMFEIERMNRAIDEERDIEALKRLTKQLVSAWHTQKAATAWVMSHKLPAPFKLEVQDEQPAPELAPKPKRPEEDVVG